MGVADGSGDGVGVSASQEGPNVGSCAYTVGAEEGMRKKEKTINRDKKNLIDNFILDYR